MLFLALPAHAAMHTLDPGDSIQDAVNAAAENDIIILNPGTYTGHDIRVPKNLTIRANTSFSGTAENTVIDAGMGGTIFNFTGQYHIYGLDNLTLENGWSSDSGGAIRTFSPDSIIVMTSSAIRNCSTRQKGGAAFVSNGSHVILMASEIANCSAGRGGAIANTDGSSFFLIKSQISDCSAGYGGTIFDDNGSNTLILNSTISGSSATGSGGTIYHDNGNTLTLIESTISRSSAGSGGAIFASNGSSVLLTGSSIAGASATAHGGALVANASRIALFSSTIRNVSAHRGGAAYADIRGTISAESTVIANASATEGGAFFGDRGARLSLTLSNITECSAQKGGAFYGDNGSNIQVTGSSIAGCSARHGGVAYDDRGSNLWITASGVTNSSAHGGNGGAVYNDRGSNMWLTVSEIANCSARNGGAVYQDHGSNAWMTASAISGSSAISGNGGALFTAGNSSALMNRVSIADCSAPWGKGGGIYYDTGNNFLVTSSSITNCAARHGSGVYSTNSTGTLVFSRVYQNTGTAVVSYHGSLNATRTWWGTNAGPGGMTAGTVVVDPWLVLGIAASPSRIAPGQSAVIRANLTFDSTGTDTLAEGSVPYGIPVAFMITDGSGSLSAMTPVMDDGSAETEFTSFATGKDIIGATVDGATVTIPILVNPAPSIPPTNDGQDDGDMPVPSPLNSIGKESTVDVNVGGGSAIGSMIVRGTGISDLIVTGTVQPGPGEGTKPAPGIVYQYVDLVPARYTTIRNAQITFVVPRSWLAVHGLAVQDIVLFHRNGTGWEALPTTAGTTVNGQLTFTATAERLSLVAISGMKGAGITPATPDGSLTSGATRTPAPPVARIVHRQKETTPVPAPQEPPADSLPSPLSSGLPVTAALLGAGCATLAASFTFIQRWWIRRQNPALFREYD